MVKSTTVATTVKKQKKKKLQTNKPKMDAEGERSNKKRERTTPEQLRFFIEFWRQHPQMRTGKKDPRLIQDLWRQLSEGLNERRGPTRKPEEWKVSLSGWKKQLRCRAKKAHAERIATGGDPANAALQLTEFEEFALASLGSAVIDGAPGVSPMGFEEHNFADNASFVPIDVEIENDIQNPIRESVLDYTLDSTSTSTPTQPSPRPSKRRYSTARDSMFEFLKDSIAKREEAAAQREEAAAKREEAAAKREEAAAKREEAAAKREEAAAKREEATTAANLKLAEALTALKRRVVNKRK